MFFHFEVLKIVSGAWLKASVSGNLRYYYCFDGAKYACSEEIKVISPAKCVYLAVCPYHGRHVVQGAS